MTKDTPEEMAKIVAEVAESITNPDPEKAAQALRTNSLALGLVADKHRIPVRAVWDIVRNMQDDPNTPWEQPESTKTPEEMIFWDFIAEHDLLAQ